VVSGGNCLNSSPNTDLVLTAEHTNENTGADNTSAEQTALEAAVAKLRAAGAPVWVVRTDLSEADGVERLWHEIEQLGRPLDAAALNAGLGKGGTS
jgi:NAD(P)-dependent dehydrogenase (short-subunit alcohol dehydrogenase family)